VGGVDDQTLEAALPAEANGRESSTVPIAVDVTQTLLNTLKSALDRRLRILVNNLALSVRMIGWPTLIFVATYGIAELSTDVQSYLHSPKGLADLVQFILPAAGWGVLATAGVVFSAALMVFKWRVADNTFRFLGLVGFVVLLTFWIFSLALWGFNQLLLRTNALTRHPFDPPSFTTAISFAALVLFGLLLATRRVRGPRRPVITQPMGAPVIAGDVDGTSTAG